MRGSYTPMRRRPLLVLAAVVALLIAGGAAVIARRPFPPDTTPEGAYARIALAVARRQPGDAFAYLETEAQWACYTIRDARAKALERVRASYPAEQRDPLVAAWNEEASAPDGADVFAIEAARKGWIARLERDLSGVASVEVQGERATVVTARGTRYPFRRRDSGIWGLTIFTADLEADAQRASRDLETVERAADDFEHGRP